MNDIIHEMSYKMPKAVFGFYIFLTAIMTKSPVKGGTAVKTDFFFPFR